jgi:hypothetical protein
MAGAGLDLWSGRGVIRPHRPFLVSARNDQFLREQNVSDRIVSG